MNANTLPMNTSKYEKLEERANAQINKHNYSNDQAIRDVPEIRQVTDKISQEQKRKSDSNSTQPSRAHIFLPSSTKDIYSPTGKRQVYKLVDSRQVSKPFHQSDKRTSLLDTYARIAASNNKRCPKRLRELAKPKRQARDDSDNRTVNFNLNHWSTTKTHTIKTRHDTENSKRS